VIWQLIDSSGLGGAERHVATISSSLQQRGADVQVILLNRHRRNEWFKQLSALDLPYKSLDGTFRTLLTEVRTAKPDLLHTHGYKAGLFGRLAATFAGIPVVSTFHSGKRGSFPVSVYEFFDEWSALVGQNIAVGENVASRLPWPSEIMASYVAEPQFDLTKPLPRTVAFVGRLSEEKGPELFCRLAIRASPNLSCHVYGDGPLAAQLQRLYGHRIIFHGATADLESVWPTIGLIVMPSRFEGLPLTALEALARGIPVLASNVGGLPDLVKPGLTGWLFEPGDLATATDYVKHWKNMSTSRQVEMRIDCHAHVMKYFSEHVQFPKLLKVYRDAGLSPSRLGATDLANANF
jgi:glycosyltransferase involved in cell wall biosynthesis